MYEEPREWQFEWSDQSSWLRADAIVLGQCLTQDFRYLPYVLRDNPSEKFVRATKTARQVSFRYGFLLDYHNVEHVHFSLQHWPVLYARPGDDWSVLESVHGMGGVARSPALTYFAQDVVPFDFGDEALRAAQSSSL